MADFLRALVDELLGKDRNLSIAERLKQKEHYSDENVSTYIYIYIKYTYYINPFF